MSNITVSGPQDTLLAQANIKKVFMNVDNRFVQVPIGTALEGVANSALANKADLIGGKLDPAQLPDLAIAQYLGEVANQAAMLALTGQSGDWCSRTDTGMVYVVTGNSSVVSGWTQLKYPASAVQSVCGLSGTITLAQLSAALSANFATTAQGTKADNAMPNTIDAVQAVLDAAKNGDATAQGKLADIRFLVSADRPKFVRPLYFNRLLHELPQCAAASGVGNTARGDCRWNVTMTAGSNVVVYTGGTAIADAGAGNFAGVMLVGGKYSVVNVLGISGNNITLAQTMSAPGAAVLGSYHDAVNGQHLSPMGGYALADLLCNASPYALQDWNVLYGADSIRGNWYAQPWVSPYTSPEYWHAYGGIANNQVGWNSASNIFNAAGIVYKVNRGAVGATCSAVGHGLELIVRVGGSAVVDVQAGHDGVDASLQIQVQVLSDGVVVYTGAQGGALTRHVAPLSCATATIRVTSLSASALNLSVSRAVIRQLAPAYQRAIEPGDVILPIGDSWTDEVGNTPPARPEFILGIRNYAATIGATVLPSVGVGGTKASYALAAVSGVRRIDSWISAALVQKCTKVLIHYYINDYNGSDSATTWSANLAEIERTCINAGLVPVFVLPGCTASSSQTQSLNHLYQGVVGVSAEIRQITKCLPTELAGAAMFVNTVGKYAGRAIYVQGVGTYIARGGAASDVWDCITAGATPATVTPA